MAKDHNYWVYFMASVSGVLYIGVTNDLRRRVHEHRSGIAKGFSQKYKTQKLVYFEHFTNVDYAIRREKEIKKWRRSKKTKLIDSLNPSWQDLSEKFMG